MDCNYGTAPLGRFGRTDPCSDARHLPGRPLAGRRRCAPRAPWRSIETEGPSCESPGSRYGRCGPSSIRCMSPEGRRLATSARPAAPELKYPRARDQRTWIFRCALEVKQRGLYLLAAGDRLRNDQVGRRVECRPWHGFRFTFDFDRLDDLDFGLADAGFQEVAVELAPDCMVATRAPDYLRVRPSEEVESGPAWMARPTIEIGVLHYQDSAGAYRLPHTAKHLYRLRKMLQDETGVDDIVSSMFVPLAQIHGPESDVGQTSRCGGLARQ